jgi:CelD/BcsL family acetyltransferase involved in cellulose biosynthesis
MHGVNELLSYAIDEYRVDICAKIEPKNIEKQWRELESRNQVPFFLSWQWVSTWIETYQPQLVSVSAFHQDKIVCLGLFTQSIESRNGFVRSQQLRLLQTGKAAEDQIWVEYNDFIGDKQHLTAAVNTCLKALIKSPLFKDEIVASMITESRANDISSQFSLAKVSMITPCYLTNLDTVGGNYLASLSSNTRQQIRRSIRLYEKTYGELAIDTAHNYQQAIEYFHQAGQYHVKRWDDSGFKNNNFVRFHENLIKNAFSEGAVQLLKLSAGDEVIAILYYHISNKRVHFYLQGIQYHQDKKLKPGLVAHTLATNYFLKQGMKSYDYMGGYSRYKTQLSKPSGNLVRLTVQRPGSRFKLEDIARKIKTRIIQSFKKHKIYA